MHTYLTCVCVCVWKQAAIVCTRKRVYESRQGVVRQFYLNWERRVALLRVSVQKAFYLWPLS